MQFGMRPLTDAVGGAGPEVLVVGAVVANYRRLVVLVHRFGHNAGELILDATNAAVTHPAELDFAPRPDRQTIGVRTDAPVEDPHR